MVPGARASRSRGVRRALTVYFYLQEQWVGVVVALFAYGTLASNYLYACHELGHGTVFRTKWLNEFFLRVFSVLGWWNFHEYAMSHTYHHVYTLHPRADKEVTLPPSRPCGRSTCCSSSPSTSPAASRRAGSASRFSGPSGPPSAATACSAPPAGWRISTPAVPRPGAGP